MTAIKRAIAEWDLNLRLKRGWTIKEELVKGTLEYPLFAKVFVFLALTIDS